MSNSFGTNETARLMYDIGKAVNMNYGCAASSTTDNYIIPGFKHFGYNNVNVKNVSNFEDATLDSNLAANKPVLFTGFDKMEMVVTHGSAMAHIIM